MALVIEDGSIVAGANSYASVAELVDFASSRGLTIPTSNADRELSLVRAFDYIELQRDRFLGHPTSSTQQTAFPRYGLRVGTHVIASNEIPWELKRAQLIIAARAGVETELVPPSLPDAKGAVTSERVGPIARTYAAPQATLGAATLVRYPDAEALLRRFMRPRGVLTVTRG